MSLDHIELNSSYEKGLLPKSSVISEISQTMLARLSRKTGYTINELALRIKKGATEKEIYSEIKKGLKEQIKLFYSEKSIKGLFNYFNQVQI